ncbi:MAG: response regulator [Burkholderiaceae bacterium]
MIRVLVADDHSLIREGLKRILSGTQDLVVCGEADDGASVISEVAALKPDALLLDLSMPGTRGFDLIKRLRTDHPRLPILVLSMHDEQQYAVRAIRAGASGYLTKEGANTQLVNAIRKVAQGRPYISTVVAEQLATHAMPGQYSQLHEELTDRELQVLRMLVQGTTVSQVARSLNLSVKTVSTHKSRVLGKLHLSSLAELVRYALEHNLVEKPAADGLTGA